MKVNYLKLYLIFLSIVGGIAAICIVVLRGFASWLTNMGIFIMAMLPVALYFASRQASREKMFGGLARIRWPTVFLGVLILAVGLSRFVVTRSFSIAGTGLSLFGTVLIVFVFLTTRKGIQDWIWKVLSRLGDASPFDQGQEGGGDLPGGFVALLSVVVILGGIVCLSLDRWVWSGLGFGVSIAAGALVSVVCQVIFLVVLLSFPAWLNRFVKLFWGGNHLFVLLLTSTAVAVTLFVTYPIMFHYDSNSYWQNALVLMGQQQGSDVYGYRTPAYPLLVALMSLLSGGSLWGLMILQTLMAILMPIIIYRTVLLVHRPAAFYCALVSILSLVPYSYMKAVMTETSYMFFILLAIYLFVLYLKSEKLMHGMGALLTCIFLVMLRPSASLLFFIFLVLFVFYRPRKYLFLGLSIMIYLLYSFGISLYERELYAGADIEWTGRVLFFNVYQAPSDGQGRNPPLSRSDGPATAALIDTVEGYLAENPTFPERYRGRSYYDEFFEPFEGDPHGLAENVLINPGDAYWGFLWDVLRAATPSTSDALFLNAAVEQLKRDPFMAVKYVFRNAYYYFFGPPAYYIDGYPSCYYTTGVYYTGLTYGSDTIAVSGLPQAMVRDLESEPGADYPKRHELMVFWGRFFLYLRPTVFVLALLGAWKLIKQSSTRLFAILCWLVVLYSAAVVCVFQVPLDRYIYQNFLVEVLLAGPGIYLTLQGIRHGRVAKPEK